MLNVKYLNNIYAFKLFIHFNVWMFLSYSYVIMFSIFKFKSYFLFQHKR